MVRVVTKYCSRQILCHTLEIIPDYLGNFVESENLIKVQHLHKFSTQMCSLAGPGHMQQIIISELLLGNPGIMKKLYFEAGLVFVKPKFDHQRY